MAPQTPAVLSNSDYVALAQSAFDQGNVEIGFSQLAKNNQPTNLQSVAKLLDEPIEGTWEYVTEVEACAMYRRTADEAENNSGIHTVQTMANFDFPAKEIFEFIWNTEHRKKWDGYINNLKVVVDIKDELVEPIEALDVLYAAFSMPWPITSRDFVHIRFDF
jgi:hypothetical protein